MKRQQIDPIAQAMQILQLVTQRQGQQAGIEQANRGLDLQAAQQAQRANEFQQGLSQEQQAQLARQAQLDKEFQYRSQQDQQQNAFREKTFGSEQTYRDAMIKKINDEIASGKAKDQAMSDYYNAKNVAEFFGLAQPKTLQEADQLQNQIAAARNFWMQRAGMTPPAPIMPSQEELNYRKTAQ